MLALPGPAFVVIPIGLAILSLEFAWAEHLLEKALIKGEEAKRKASEASPAQKALTGRRRRMRRRRRDHGGDPLGHPPAPRSDFATAGAHGRRPAPSRSLAPG